MICPDISTGYNWILRDVVLPKKMIAKNRVLTLDEFTIQDLRNFPHATGELSRLLRDIGLAAKRINVEVNKAGIADILGYSDSINVQGEDVMKLDDFANK